MVFSLFGVLSVLLEALRPVLPLIAIALLIEAVLVVGALLRQRKGSLDWMGARNISAIVGIIFFVGALVLAPWVTGASHGQLEGLLDYAALVAASLGAGVAAFVACMPALLCFRPTHRSSFK